METKIIKQIKTLLLTVCIELVVNIGHAQNFQEHLVNRPIALPIKSQVVDIDNDGDNDVITISRSGEVVWYEHKTSFPLFQVHYIEDNTGGMKENKALIIADIDSDGDMDILTISTYPNETLYWYQNDGNQNFSRSVIPYDPQYSNNVLLVEDLDNDGDNDIITFKGLEIIFLENDGNQTFTEQTAFVNSSGINELKILDVDQDGLKDVIVGRNPGFSWIKQENENFTEYPISTIGNFTHFDMADIDLDGDIDFTGLKSGVAYLYYNDGSGSAFTETFMPSSPSANGGIFLSDINNDIYPDFIYFNNGYGEYSGIRVHLNENSSGFSTNPLLIAYSNTYPSNDLDDMTVKDFNQDGKNDIVLTYENVGRVNLFQITDITQPVNADMIEVSQSAGNVKDISVADFNGDGFMDVISSSHLDHTLDLYTNSGNNLDFSFTTIDTLLGPTKNEEADIDQDGDIDIVACQGEPNENANFFWYENDGNGVFEYHFLKNINNGGAHPKDVKIADIDNDNDIDIVAVSYPYTYILYNDGSENFTSYTIPGLDQITYTVAINDVDGDGLKDIILWYIGEMSYCKNYGSTFSTPLALNLNNSSGTFSNIYSIELADMDNDTDLDIVFSTASNASIGYMENLGALNYNLSPIVDYTIQDYGIDLKLGDIDSDGDIDIALAGSGSAFFIENTTDGFIYNRLLDIDGYYAYSNLFSIQLKDFDNDNDLDIVYSGSQGARIAWLEQSILTSIDLEDEISFSKVQILYPNPTTGELNIDLDANYDEATVVISNTLGQIIHSEIYTTKGVLQLNIPGEAGLYFVELNVAGKKEVIKVIKK